MQGRSELHGVAFHYESGGWFEQDIQGDQETLQKGKEQKKKKPSNCELTDIILYTFIILLPPLSGYLWDHL